jgi:mannose-6-phosphate isomerase
LTLRELVTSCGAELFGIQHPQPQFPLLFKFLDANQTLSVQVHPGDADAARLDPPDLGKTEAWVMLYADPGSRVYAGLKSGVERPALERAIADGTTESCLHWFEPQTGDCVFIPAGTVHALGAGLVVAEIQQASDTTFRLFDWNRVGPDGRPRPLHVRDGLAAIDYQRGPVGPQTPQPTGRSRVHRLVECDRFVLDRWSFSDPQIVGGDERFHILAVMEGAMTVSGDPAGEPLVQGQTVLLPGSVGRVRLTPHAPTVLLDMYLPLALAHQSAQSIGQ